MLKVELVYVPSDNDPYYRELTVAEGSTVEDLLLSSGVFDVYPEAAELKIGIYAKAVTKDTVLREGDRVELYRPLLLDPKQRRKQRAKK